MTDKYRSYLREMNQKRIDSLNIEYKDSVKPRNSGFLSTKDKEKILHIRNWEQETNEDDLYNFFFDIREKAKSAIKDFELLCDTLTEDQLEKTFGKNKTSHSLVSHLIQKLIPASSHITSKKMKKYEKESLMNKEWRKDLLNDIIIDGLEWNLHSGLIKTQTEQRTIKEAADVISVASTGVNTYLQEPKTVFL